jgi:hypothetical protein
VLRRAALPSTRLWERHPEVVRSAALVSSPAYWRDEPGRRSMRLNYEMQGKGTVTIA